MNKLEELKMSKAIEYGKQMKSERSKLDYEDGFDDCLALDLPVKFYTWALDHSGDVAHLQFDNDKQLYQYWLKFVYKLD